jgi:hypothetical protein
MASDFLKAGIPIRCLYKLEFTSSDRSPRFTKDWAGSHLDIVCEALGNIIEGDTSVFEKQLLIIQMRQKHVYICADIFRKCSPQTLHRQSSDTIAIYEIVRDENGYCLSRNKSLDARVRAEYIRLQELDKGDLPVSSILYMFSARIAEPASSLLLRTILLPSRIYDGRVSANLSDAGTPPSSESSLYVYSEWPNRSRTTVAGSICAVAVAMMS